VFRPLTILSLSSLIAKQAVQQYNTRNTQPLCPRRTFLASLILALKFTQGQCYSNEAWAKLSGLPPCKIGCYEHALGDAWVGKTPVGSAAALLSANRAVARSESDGELFTDTVQFNNGDNPTSSTLHCGTYH